MHSPVVKICGLARPEDVAFCHALGVEFTGFVLAAESPRRIPPAAVAGMPRGGSARVGVVTTGDAAAILTAAREASLEYVQLHGGQNESVCRAVGPERVIKVFWPERSGPEVLQEELYRFAPVAAYFLFDSGTGGGGSGRRFQRKRLQGLDIPRPWFLAGGIAPDTAASAMAAIAPFGLDASSGVELAPGVKDHGKIHGLITVARQQNNKERQCE